MHTTARTIAILLSLLLCTGCAAAQPDSVATTETAESATTTPATTESLWEAIPGESDTEEAAEEIEDGIVLYAYEHLDADEQVIYDELLRMITSRVETNLSTDDKDEVHEIYNMVLADHPEIFYVDGYTITSHTRGGALEYLSARANYTYDEEETAEYERLIETAVDSILLQAPTDGSDYDKVKFCYEYIIRNTDYDTAAESNQDIHSVFLNHASVCSGYAKAMQYLLAKLDIPATLVTGTTDGASHAWDLVLLDGAYYYVDPTWGDAQFTGSAASDRIWITYDYLNITTADLLTNHVPDDTIPLPECTATEDNYYVKEGLWFDSFSQSQLQTLINKAYADGDLSIAVRCADEGVYQEMYTALITNKEIYNYLYGSTSVTYSTSDTLHTISILFN